MDRKEQLNSLLQIEKVEDIKSLKIINQFEDDHLQCVDCKINDIDIDFYYYDDIGFLTYYDESKRAFKHLKDAIENSVEIALEYLEEEY